MGVDVGDPGSARIVGPDARARTCASRASRSSCSASARRCFPPARRISSDMIGGLLIAAGLIETVAGSLRREVRPFAMAAGVVTALAGLLFVLNPETHFFPDGRRRSSAGCWCEA